MEEVWLGPPAAFRSAGGRAGQHEAARLQTPGDLLSRRLGLQQARVLPAEDHDDADVVIESGEVDGHPAPFLGKRVVGFEAEEAGGGLQGAGLGGQVQRRGTWGGRAMPSGVRAPTGLENRGADAQPQSSAVWVHASR